MSKGLKRGSSGAGQSAHGQMCWELMSTGLSKTGHKEWGFRRGAIDTGLLKSWAFVHHPIGVAVR